MVLNFPAAGLTAVLGHALFGRGGKSPALAREARLGPIELSLAQTLVEITLLGSLWSESPFGHSLPVYLAFAAAPASWWVLWRTRFGLRLRAAGAYLSLGPSAGFSPEMSACKGFIGLAALIFAKWRPVQAMAACLPFGFLDAAAIRLQGVDLPLIGRAPVKLMQAAPYILTVALLAGLIGRATPPKAGGRPYLKER